MLLISYTIIFILFSASYTLNIISLVLPKWLSLVEQSSYKEYNIGLFRLCEVPSGQCKPFPDMQSDHCKPKEFCILWKIIISCNLTSLLIGTLIILGLLGIIFCHNNHKQRHRSWRLIIRLLFLYSFPLILSCILFLYVSSDTTNFPIPILYINFNVSFILNVISWCINLIISLSMLFTMAIVQNYHRHF